jgi:acyl-coenzyme A thioesterase PaaI-like protein
VDSNADLTRLAALADEPALRRDPRPGTRALADSALGVLGIELLVCEPARVVARMPLVDGDPGARSTLLVLAETVASTAAGIAAGTGRRAFGAELDASWLEQDVPATGVVVGEATPLRLDPELHTWRIVVVDRSGAQLLEARCTLGVVDAPLN